MIILLYKNSILWKQVPVDESDIIISLVILRPINSATSTERWTSVLFRTMIPGSAQIPFMSLHE